MRFLGVLACIVLVTAPTRARADNGHNTAAFEFQIMLALGGPAGLYDDVKATPQPFVALLGARIRSPKHSIVGIELYELVPNGFGAATIIDVWRSEHLRVHLLDLGIFANLGKPVSVQRHQRSYDITLGGGIELRFESLSFTFDYRMFLPDLYDTLGNYGGFSKPWYTEAAKGGVLLWGISKSFSVP
jgi:hypothetical protein